MNGWTAKIIVISLVVLFVAAPARAAGPQFQGLLNIYSSFYNKSGNSLALMDKDGPIAESVVPLPGNWSDIVVAPNGSAYYAIVNFNQEFYKIDPVTKAATRMTISGPGITDSSWMVGETWDTTRNRLVLGTLGGEGFFLGYIDSANQWNLISSLHQVDLRAITYRPSDDLIYALPNTIGAPMTQILKYNAATGQQVGVLNLPQPIPEHEFGTDLMWQLMLASDGQLAVIAPRPVASGNWLYLINPDSGVITHSAPLPVPEPGMVGLALAGFGLLLRRGVRAR